MSETARYRDLVQKYCFVKREEDIGWPGCGIDVGCGGETVVPWAIGMDLPVTASEEYGNRKVPRCQLRGFAEKLPFESDSLDFVYSSHLLEDFEKWEPILIEWMRVLRPGGYLIIILPDKELWAKAIQNGQPPNKNHKHEATVGELSSYASFLHYEVVEDRRTNLFDGDYSILFVARKP